MKNQLRELLDRIYELEGMVHLAIKRDDSSQDFIRLISNKGDEVALLISELKGVNPQISGGDPDSDDDYNFSEYSIDDAPEQLNSESSSIIEQKKEGKGKLVFSINERFRFKKELFDNSDADFNNTLALVASMEDYDEAEEYFITEEGFQRNDPVVREFLEIIKKYFQ